MRRLGRRPGGPRDLQNVAGGRETPGKQRCTPRVEIGLAREAPVERLETLRRVQQLCRNPAPSAPDRHDLPAQQLHPGALKLVERPGLRCGQQPKCEIERAGVQTGLGGVQRAVGTTRGLVGQRDGALQERRRGGEPAAYLRPPDRALEL